MDLKMILVVLLYGLIALSFTIAKVAVEYAHPLFLIGVRMMTAGTLLLAVQLLRKRKEQHPWRMSRQDLILFLQVALFHVYFAFVLEFWALQFMPSIKVAIMYSMTPFITIILSYFLYNQVITGRQLFGVMVAFCGLLPLLLRSCESLPAMILGAYCVSWAEIALIGAILSATYAWFLIKRVMAAGYSLVTINGTAMLVGGIMSYATWLLVRTPADVSVMNMQYFLITTGLLILISNVLIYNLYGWLLHTYSLNFLAFAGFLSPIFCALFGVLFLHESFGFEHIVAIGSISLGLYFFYRDEL